MKTATYTEKQIIEAGQQLLEQQKTVTPFGIRNLIGGGNPARIKAIWTKYNKTHNPNQTEKSALELPTKFNTNLETIKNHLDDLATKLYNHANQIAELSVQESINNTQKAKQQAELETQEAMETVSQQDKKIQSLKETINELRTQQKNLEQQNTILNAQKEDLNQRLTTSLKKEEKAKIEAAEIRGQLKVLS